MLNLACILEESAKTHPQNIAFQYENIALSFQQINQMANQIANGLKGIGIVPGDKVMLSCINIPYFPMIYYGILKAGAVVVPINIMLKQQEIAYHLENSNAKAVFCFTGTPDIPMVKFAHEAFIAQKNTGNCKHFIEITPQPQAAATYENTLTVGQFMHTQSPVFELTATNPNDTAVILYTSGTTGKPKGAELSHFNLFTNAWDAAEIFKYTDTDVSLIALPLFHSFAQTVQMNAAVKRASKTILIAKFLPKVVLSKMFQEGVTLFCGVPTMYWALKQVAQDPEIKEILPAIAQKLKICCSGGAALPVEDLKEFESLFGTEILEGYGLSEASPVVCFNRPNTKRKIGSIGFSIPNLKVKVVDSEGKNVPNGEVGELIVQGPNVMKGYYNNAEATRAALKNNWLHTGDLAKIDDEGYVYIVDRTKDMIIKNGFNVYPREIEEILVQHEAVLQCAVVGVKTAGQGEEIKAFVVLRPSVHPSEKEILQFLRDRLANYKIPKEVIFKESLPMNATGKILKTALRESNE